MIQQWKDEMQNPTIQDKLSLFVGSGDNVSNHTQSRSLNLDLFVRQQWNNEWKNLNNY
jgi:hypothetical protein